MVKNHAVDVVRQAFSRSSRRALIGLACAALAGAWLAPSASRAQHIQVQDQEPDPWGESSGDDIAIKLVTFGPGDDVYNYFGHNAIIVQDRAQDQARLYNYGMFHFGPDMLPNYMKGRLTFWVGQAPVRGTFARYIEMNRSIHVQELNLGPEQRLALARTLSRTVLPENRNYLYHHYFNNCSTKLRDLIDTAIGGQFKQAMQAPARMSYRAHTRRYASQDPFIDFVLVFWMNDQMEAHIKRWDEMFLPGELEHQAAAMQYVNQSGQRVPLVGTSYTVFEAQRAPTPALPPTTWPWALLVGTAIGLLALLTTRLMQRTRGSLARRFFGAQHALLGLLFGLPGLLGFLMWTLTEHTVTYRNENQLLANPLTFMYLPLGVAIAFGSRSALRISRWISYALAVSSLALLVLKLLPSFDQDTLLPMTLIIPVNVLYALAHRSLASAAQAQSVAAPAAATALAGESRS
jgi:hypothetical protein